MYVENHRNTRHEQEYVLCILVRYNIEAQKEKHATLIIIFRPDSCDNLKKKFRR